MANLTASMVSSSRATPGGPLRVQLRGRWDIRTLRTHTGDLLSLLTAYNQERAHWDLTQVEELDTAGAALLWRAWRGKRPPDIALRPADEKMFAALDALPPRKTQHPLISDPAVPLVKLGRAAQSVLAQTLGVLDLQGEVALCAARFISSPAEIPWREISANVYRSGLQALPITALVGFLIGIVLSYLSGQQLRSVGADSFIVNLMGIATLRELGPLLAAILNAGRSGSAMTAQIGLMRVTGELDAMSVLGISPTLRLVLPRVLGQAVALPLVVLWTDVLAVIGGMVGAKLQLGVPYAAYLHRLPQVVPVSDLWFGVCKGAVFGALVALVACHFGLRIRPDTEGLAAGTTQSVVTSLTLVLVVDAIFAVAFSHVVS